MTPCQQTGRRAIAVMVLFWATATLGSTIVARGQVAQPETVMVTLHAKAGAEAELAQVLARHWETARRLNLTFENPHLTVTATEQGNKTYFVEIFTWRDAGIPDAEPAAIQAIWTDMNRLTEARDGRPGIDITAVSVVNLAGQATSR